MKTRKEIIEILCDHLTTADCDTCELRKKCKNPESEYCGTFWELSENEAARIADEILGD